MLKFRALLYVLLLCLAGLVESADLPTLYPQVRSIFPEADGFSGFEGTPPSVAAYKEGKVLGYLFLTNDVLRIPAYSGKPINTLVGMDKEGRIAGLAIVQHDEPIIAVGITPERLNRYVAQYAGKSVFDKVIIGAERPGHVNIDGISGATITVMVENATVMRAARAVAESRGLRPAEAASTSPGTAGAVAPRPQAEAAIAQPPQPESKPLQMPEAPRPQAQVRQPQDQPASVVRNQRLEPQAVRPEPPAPKESRARPPTQTTARPAAVARDRGIETLPARAPTWAPQLEEAEWVAIWKNRQFDIAVLACGLVLLSFVLIFQDWLARDPTLLTYVRNGFHIYTLFFIGWWGLAQLSVINVLTFVTAVMHGFRWENFLIDPMLFILWGFVAVTLLLWGRGVYCGWLCPFGALQELILIASRKLKLPEVEFSDAVHERLVALKYIILIMLFGLSLQSLTEAAWYAEVEPFKTVIAMRFQREWNYVLYALILIGVAAVNRKFYCKYLCPLGAALAIPGRFRLFEWWLRRRKECGKPCQVCANHCSVRAIRTTGEINANECHYCLDCQVIYYNDKVCLPLIDRRKRREQQLQRGQQATTKDPEKTGVVAEANYNGMQSANKL